jgi:iron complex transport system substrate-binding protein
MAFPHAPTRIACLQPSASVILAAIGEIGRVVACTCYCADVVPELSGSSCTLLADSWSASAEEIAIVRPDLVIASVPYQEKSVIEILKAGVRFLGLAPKCLEDIYTDILAIAGMVGASARGEEVVGEMQRRIEEVRHRAAGAPRPRVYCEEWGKPLIISQRWVAELVEAAGGNFMAAPGRQVSATEISALDPEVVIAAWCGAGDRVPLEKIVAQRGWQNTSAAHHDRIFCIRDEFLNTPAPTLLRGLDALAFAIHPEVFPRVEGIRQITDVLSSTASNPSL